jgi:hypothetical protein
MTITTEARIQDGTINTGDDFWQLIMDVGYLVEGESQQYERERLHWLNECLEKFFSDHPEITVDGHPTHFAMHAVRRLVGAFIFNDEHM